MKKNLILLFIIFLVLYMSFIQSTTYASDYIGHFFFEDFETFEVGRLFESDHFSIYEKEKHGGSIHIVTINENNWCEITSKYLPEASEHDAFLDTAYFGSNGKVIAQATVKCESSENGHFAIRFRDGSGKIIAPVKIQNNKIIYLGDFDKDRVVENFPDGTVAHITIEIHPLTGEIRVYEKEILKARILNLREKYPGFNTMNFLYRLQTVSSASEIKAYVDNIKLTTDISLDERYGIYIPEVYESNGASANGTFQDGKYDVFVPFENNTQKSCTALMVLAHYSGDRLKQVEVSEKYVVQPLSEINLQSSIEIKGTRSGDQMRVLVFEDLECVKPLSRYVELSRIPIRRPSEADLEEAFMRKGVNVHPRIIAEKRDFERIKNSNDRYINSWKDIIINRADTIVAANIHSENSSYYIAYIIPDGQRLLNMSRRVLACTQTLGMAYQMTQDEKYGEKVWEILYKAGAFSDWNPSHYLDTAEMTAAFAIGYDWCFDYFNDQQRMYIEDAIITHGLRVAEKAYKGESIPGGNWWINIDHNWNVVCNGGMIVGAMAIADRCPELSFYITKQALRNLEYMLVSFAPDGGWVEGPGYWGYTTEYLAYMCSTLLSSLGTEFDVMSVEGMVTTGDFILHAEGPTGMNNFHDAGQGKINAPQLFWLGKIFDNQNYTAARLSHITNDHLSISPLDLLWYTGGSQSIQLPKDAYFRNVEMVSMREKWNDDHAAWVSFHNGKTYVNHAHVDNGSFVFDMLGERWAIDLGSEPLSYQISYKGSRWDLYRTRAEAHNTLVINPDQSVGQTAAVNAPVTRFEWKETGALAVMDLSSSYANGANSVIRGIKLDENRRALTIRDEIDLKEESDIFWFMQTKATVAAVMGKYVILVQNGKMLKMEFITNADYAEFTVGPSAPLPTSPNPEGQAQNVGINRIAIKVRGSSKVNITVKFTPFGTNEVFSGVSDTPIERWTLR